MTHDLCSIPLVTVRYGSGKVVQYLWQCTGVKNKVHSFEEVYFYQHKITSHVTKSIYTQCFYKTKWYIRLMYRYNNILCIFHRKDTEMIYTKYLHKFAVLNVVFIFQYKGLYCYALIYIDMLSMLICMFVWMVIHCTDCEDMNQ